MKRTVVEIVRPTWKDQVGPAKGLGASCPGKRGSLKHCPWQQAVSLSMHWVPPMRPALPLIPFLGTHCSPSPSQGGPWGIEGSESFCKPESALGSVPARCSGWADVDGDLQDLRAPTSNYSLGKLWLCSQGGAPALRSILRDLEVLGS